jgi:hypothetical protein
VARASERNGGIRVTLSPEAPVDREIVTELLGRLLADGIAIERWRRFWSPAWRSRSARRSR